MNELYTQSEGDYSGMGRVGRQANKTAVASAVSLLADVQAGRAPDWYLKEAIAPTQPEAVRIINRNYPGVFRLSEAGHTSSDFPYLTGDIIDRMMLARYQRFGHNWRAYTKQRAPLRDFRQVRSIPLDGLEGTWSDIPEGGEVEDAALSDATYTYSPKKYGQAATLSFESIMNDDLDGFMTIPERLADSGNNTIDKFVTELYVDTNGPHASFYTGGNDNIVTGNPALSIAGIQAGYTQLAGQTNSDGAPIRVEAATLVVGTPLEVTAQNIMNQLLVDANEAGGTTNQTVRVNNWLVSRLTLVVNPWIDQIAATAMASSEYPWFLFANPNVSRPALEIGFVRGFQEPALYQKLANTIRTGSGAVDQMAGDFQTMSQRYKGVLAFGGTRLDPKMTVGSNGSGS